MQSGKLNLTIVIEQCTTTKGDAGQRDETWSTYKTRKATKIGEKGFEHHFMDKQQGVTTVKWYIRYTDGVNHKMRIKYNNQYYYIVGEPMADIRNNRMMIIRTKEASNE